jgi:DNA-binding IclR family transcriptional regulator
VGAIKSAARTLEVLEYFREHQKPSTVGEIASALMLPQSSTSMLLKSLTDLDYLDYSQAARKFTPTYRVALLGNWIRASQYANGEVTEIMDAISAETGEAVVLGLQSGSSVKYVHVLPASYPLQLAIEVGTIRPMTCTAIGQMLLSPKTNAQIKAIVRRNNADAEDATHRVKEGDLLTEIENIRGRGYSESGGRMVAGASVIAMLVPHVDGAPPLAIGVGGPIDRISQNRKTIIGIMRSKLGRR